MLVCDVHCRCVLLPHGWPFKELAESSWPSLSCSFNYGLCENCTLLTNCIPRTIAINELIHTSKLLLHATFYNCLQTFKLIYRQMYLTLRIFLVHVYSCPVWNFKLFICPYFILPSHLSLYYYYLFAYSSPKYLTCKCTCLKYTL